MGLLLRIIGLIYFFSLVIFSHIFLISDLVKGILSLSLFLILPILLGESLLFTLKPLTSIELNLNKSSNAIIHWCFGLISLTVVALVMDALYIFNANIYLAFISLGILIHIPFVGIKRYKDIKPPLDNPFKKGGNFIYFILFFVGLLFTGFITHFSPFPLLPDLDQATHSSFILTISEDNNVPNLIGYLPTFHLLYSLIITHLNGYGASFSILWFMRFLFYPLYTVGMYLFCYQISKKKALSFLCATISLWFVSSSDYHLLLTNTAPKTLVSLVFPFLLFLTHKGVSYKEFFNRQISSKNVFLFFLLSTTFIFLIFVTNFLSYMIRGATILILLFIGIAYFSLGMYLFKKEREIKQNFILLLLIASTLLFIHTPMGLLATLSIIILVFIPYALSLSPKITKILIYACVLFVCLFIILQHNGLISFLGKGINLYNRNTPESFLFKYNELLLSYSSFVLSLFIIGIVIAAHEQKDKEMPFVLAITIISFIYFLPINSITRIFFVASPFIAYFSMYSIMKLHGLFSYNRKKSHRNFLTMFFFALIITLLAINIISPLINKIEFLRSNSPTHYFTLFEKNEYDAARWVSSNTPKDSIILSDLSSHNLISGISNRPYSWQPEVFALLGGPEIKDFLLEEDTNLAYYKLPYILSLESINCPQSKFNPKILCESRNIKDNNILIILTGRTSYWLSTNSIDIYPRKFEKFNGLNKFFNETYFTLLYNDNDQIYIFGVNPEPGIPFNIN